MVTQTKGSPPITVPLHVPGTTTLSNAWVQWFNDVSQLFVKLGGLSEQDGSDAADSGLTGTGNDMSVDVDGLTSETIATDDELMFADTSESGVNRKTDLIGLFAQSHGVIQIQHASTNTAQTITTAIPYDNTKPQNDEGSEVLTLPVTFQRKGSRYMVFYQGGASTSSSGVKTVALFRDNDADAIATNLEFGGASDYATQQFYYFGTTEEEKLNTIFKIRAGTTTGNYYFLTPSGTAKYDGTVTADIIFIEWTDADGVVVTDPAIT